MEKNFDLDVEVFCKVEGLPLEIVSDLKCSISNNEITYYDSEDDRYYFIDLSNFVLGAKELVTDMYILSGNAIKSKPHTLSNKSLNDGFRCMFLSLEDSDEVIEIFFGETEEEAILKGMTWYIKGYEYCLENNIL